MNKIIFLVCLGIAVVIFLPLPATGQSCDYYSYQKCVGDNLFWYDSCGRQQEFIQYCRGGCYGNDCIDFECVSRSYQKCVGDSLYWYDSCNQQENFIKTCAGGCFGNICKGSACANRAYKLCEGNSIYWYDSCGNRQDLHQICFSGQVCQYGQCVQSYQPSGDYGGYSERHRIKCYGTALYWYDSFGVINSVYKNCSDSNTCTLDTCSGAKCANTLKCDGTTCAVGSADYIKYCSASQTGAETQCGNGICETTLNETPQNCPSDCKIGVAENIFISFLGTESATGQWKKTASAGSNGEIFFLIRVENKSEKPISAAIVSVDIPLEVYSLGNIQIDGIPTSGDIVSGIDIGSLPAGGAKTVALEGRTQTIAIDETKEAVAIITVLGETKSDSMLIDFNPEPATAAVSDAPAVSGFLAFLRRWYLWVVGALVLIFLFIVVFRRLSSEA